VSPQPIPELIAALSAEAEVEAGRAARVTAAGALADHGPDAAPAVPSLRLALWDEDWNLRVAAARALGRIGALAVEAAPDMAVLLREDAVEQVRAVTAEALAGLGDTSPTVVEALAGALRARDLDGRIRRAAARTLGALGEVLALTQALADEDADVRSDSAYALGDMGRRAEAAIPALEAALRDADEWVQDAVEEALARIRSESGRLPRQD